MKEIWLVFGSWLGALLTNKFVVLALGGALGTNARYWVGRWLGEMAWTRGFPWGTLVINVSGCFLLGVAAVVIMERLPPTYQDWYLFVGTGFCGGFTTFSTFGWETFRLLRDGSAWMAFANVAASVIAGFLAVVVAVALTGLVFPSPWEESAGETWIGSEIAEDLRSTPQPVVQTLPDN